MGYDQAWIKCTAAISNHNSSRDDEHKVAWLLFITRVKRLAELSSLSIDVESTHGVDELLPSGYGP